MATNDAINSNQILSTTASPSFAGLSITGTPINVASGGLGSGTHTVYAVLCGGTTATGAVQSIASVGTAGQGLVSNGAGSLPTFQQITPSIQTFSANGTWTKPSGVVAVIVQLVGGGGGGGGAEGVAGSAGAGGASGGFSQKLIDVSAIASETVTIGAAGSAGSSGTGGAGGATSFGAHCSATGGGGGTMLAGGAPVAFSATGAPGVGSSGDINSLGSGGFYASRNSALVVFGGYGGSSFFSGGPAGGVDDQVGTAGVYGAGGSGGAANAVTARAGGAGGAGFCIVYEYR